MKYINNSNDQLYAIVKGQTTLISPGQEIESSEAIKCVGLNPIFETVKKSSKKVIEKKSTKNKGVEPKTEILEGK